MIRGLSASAHLGTCKEPSTASQGLEGGPGWGTRGRGSRGEHSSDTCLGVIVRIRMPMKRFFQSGNETQRDSVRAAAKSCHPPSEDRQRTEVPLQDQEAAGVILLKLAQSPCGPAKLPSPDRHHGAVGCSSSSVLAPQVASCPPHPASNHVSSNPTPVASGALLSGFHTAGSPNVPCLELNSSPPTGLPQNNTHC